MFTESKGIWGIKCVVVLFNHGLLETVTPPYLYSMQQSDIFNGP